MKLFLVDSLKLSPSSPFDFDSTFHKPDHFPSKDNFWEPGIRWQTWVCQDKQLGLKFMDIGTRTEPRVQVNFYSKYNLDRKFLSSIIEEIRYRYNFDLDLNKFYKEFNHDKNLAPLIKKWRGMRPGHQSSLYEYLMIGVVLQNATVKRSVNMLQSLYENYGKPLEYDGKKLWCFWFSGDLSKVNESELRALKIGYRAKFIKRIDDQFASGVINEMELRKQDFSFQKQALLKLYGVGPATVWYLLFDVFHHYDFFEHISPWEQKIYSKLFFNHDPDDPVSIEKLINFFARYGKYRQLAVHYFWEDLWWKRNNNKIPWLEKLIRI
jgi:3-methyladenine DNA glycosylase/8-oxoguanine DNA glycosylase